MALVRVVAIPLGKIPRVQRVSSLPLFTCSPYWIEVTGGFEPCEGCVVVVVGGSSEDLFEEYKSPSSHELP